MIEQKLPEGTDSFDIVLVAVPHSEEGKLNDAVMQVSMTMTMGDINQLAVDEMMQKSFGPRMLKSLADGLIEKYRL